MTEEAIQTWLGSLRAICETRDLGRMVVALKELVLDYSPSTHLLKRVIRPVDRHQTEPHIVSRPHKGRSQQVVFLP